MAAKKWTTSLVIITFMSVLVPQLSSASTFKDVPDSVWYAPDLKFAEERGWVSGYKDKNGNDLHSFGPQDLVSLGQALKITQIAAGRSHESPPCPGCHWAEQYRGEATHDYISLNTKSLDRFITRSEAAALIGNAFHLELPHMVWQKSGERTSGGIQSSACTDTYVTSLFMDLSPNFRLCAIVAHLISMNVLQGDDASAGQPRHFRPHDFVSRAEFVRMAVNGWTAFSPESFYASVGDMKIDDEGIHANALYTTYEGGKFSVTNNSSHVVTISFSPALFKTGAPGDWNPTDGELAGWGEGPAGQLSALSVHSGWQTKISLTSDAILGLYSFVIESNGQKLKGEMVVQPDPLQRGW